MERICGGVEKNGLKVVGFFFVGWLVVDLIGGEYGEKGNNNTTTICYYYKFQNFDFWNFYIKEIMQKRARKK